MKRALILATLIVLPFADMALNAKDSASQTIKNLNIAFRGESNAAHKYEMFAQKADKDGYSQVAKMFRAISMAESIHRNNHKAAILELGGKVDVVEFDKVTPLSTKKNIELPIKGEKYEVDSMYPEFIKQAKKSNVSVAEKSFNYAYNTEKEHYALFVDALKNLGHNKKVDYCVSRISGDTKAIPVNGSCPAGECKNESYIRIK